MFGHILMFVSNAGLVYGYFSIMFWGIDRYKWHGADIPNLSACAYDELKGLEVGVLELWIIGKACSLFLSWIDRIEWQKWTEIKNKQVARFLGQQKIYNLRGLFWLIVWWLFGRAKIGKELFPPKKRAAAVEPRKHRHRYGY